LIEKLKTPLHLTTPVSGSRFTKLFLTSGSGLYMEESTEESEEASDSQ